MAVNDLPSAPEDTIDTTGEFRLGFVTVLAGVIGVLAGIVAFLIYHLIGLLTNLFFYRRVSFEFVTPPNSGLPIWVPLIPAFGGLMVGLMAKYGTPRIRGHGIPEAMEAVWNNQSTISPRVLILKPISAAVAIGTGAPFGVEGPIIQSGGAMGSVLGQWITTTVAERKVLLACGAAAGMAATFNTPLAGVLLAIELLLFEFRTRSFVPLSVASIIATGVRHPLLGSEPLLHMGELSVRLLPNLPFLLVLGVILGGAVVVFKEGYFVTEDFFDRVPVGNVFLPALGGLILGVIGLAVPRVLGVGYEVTSEILQAELPVMLIVLVVVGKTLGVYVTLGSRTSGGFLAPMFVVGAGIGSLFAFAVNAFVPGVTVSPELFALAGLGALFGVAARTTFAFVLFAVEVTQVYEAILAVFLVAVVADAVASLTLENSLMTEELARRGVTIYQEYEVDPLKRFRVEEIMDRRPATVGPDVTVSQLLGRLGFESDDDAAAVTNGGSATAVDAPAPLEAAGSAGDASAAGGERSGDDRTLHEALPIVDDEDGLVGIVTYGDLLRSVVRDDGESAVRDVGTSDLVFGYPDERVFEAAVRMASNEVEQLPIVRRDDSSELLGLLDSQNLMTSALEQLKEEQVREEGKFSVFE
jgi:H+/Cl- antiporter ClcA/CBS domain-containing protein